MSSQNRNSGALLKPNLAKRCRRIQKRKGKKKKILEQGVSMNVVY